MRIAYFDCGAGASGDMILGALVDAGYPVEALRAALDTLGVEGWRVEARPVERGGLRGTQLVVDAERGRHFGTLGDMVAPIEKSGSGPDSSSAATPSTSRSSRSSSSPPTSCRPCA